MNTRKILVIAALATALPLSFAATATATETIVEDFTRDADIRDGDPLRWQVSPHGPGEYEPGQGGLEITDAFDPNGFATFAGTERIFSGDVTMRTHGILLGSMLQLGLHFDSDAVSGYVVRVISSKRADLRRWDATKPTPLLTLSLAFDPTQTEFEVELSAREDLTGGQVIELRVWPDGTERPNEPLAKKDDDTYTSGPVMLGGGGDEDTVVAVFYSLEISQCDTAPLDAPRFRRGDCNDDGTVNVSDAVCILNWLFAGGLSPGCVAATNINGDDGANIADATYLLNYLFAGGTEPIGPFPDCGTSDLQTDQLGCETPQRNCQQ